MPDIGILEILIAFFLFIPLCRPFLKNFILIEGFAYFPPIAVFCVIAIFPAYGFRPECVPLLVFALISNALNLSSLSASISHLRYSADAERGSVYFMVMLVFLTVSVFIALSFMPFTDTAGLPVAKSEIFKPTGEENEYLLRYYYDDKSSYSNETPVILAAPPVLGSSSVIDMICAAMEQKGFLVANFSHSDFDLFSVDVEGRVSYPTFKTAKKIITSVFNRDNAYFEDIRGKDIDTVLPVIRKRFPSRKIFIIAYGASGSALASLSRDADFVAANPDISGGIIIESSSYSYVPDARFPVLCVASDMSKTESGLMKIVSYDKLGRFDFSDVPEKYPIIRSVLRENKKGLINNNECIPFAATIMADFINASLKRANGTDAQ